MEQGSQVLTLTGNPEKHRGGPVPAAPFDFDRPNELAESLRGCEVIYNTYWIRFARGHLTFDTAIRNSLTLIHAARQAGVRRIIHVSITNPSKDSPLPYFHGKAVVEEAIRESGLSYAILRPAVIFGRKGILLNNIAWSLRHFPVFPVPGNGRYELRPIYVGDLADLAVRLSQTDDNVITDAVGPEQFSFNALLDEIKRILGSRTAILHLPPSLALMMTSLVGWVIGDVVMTRDEVRGLLWNLLKSDGPPTGDTRLSEWLRENAHWLGMSYMSEIAVHYRRDV